MMLVVYPWALTGLTHYGNSCVPCDYWWLQRALLPSMRKNQCSTCHASKWATCGPHNRRERSVQRTQRHWLYTGMHMLSGAGIRQQNRTGSRLGDQALIPKKHGYYMMHLTCITMLVNASNLHCNARNARLRTA